MIFTVQDIMNYSILLINFINYNKNEVTTIILDKLHSEHRGKTFMYKKDKERFEAKTLNSYINTIRKSSILMINVKFGQSKLKSFKYFKDEDKRFFQHKLLILDSSVTLTTITDDEIKYTLRFFETHALL